MQNIAKLSQGGPSTSSYPGRNFDTQSTPNHDSKHEQRRSIAAPTYDRDEKSHRGFPHTSQAIQTGGPSANVRDPFAFDDDEDDFKPLRPQEVNVQPPPYSGVRNEFLDDDPTVAQPHSRRGLGLQPAQGYSTTGSGYGSPQPVSGEPTAPSGASTSKGIWSKWISNVKDKLKRKK